MQIQTAPASKAADVRDFAHHHFGTIVLITLTTGAIMGAFTGEHVFGDWMERPLLTMIVVIASAIINALIIGLLAFIAYVIVYRSACSRDNLVARQRNIDDVQQMR